MPPKAKKVDPKKVEPTEDESGIPKNDILFKFHFQVKQNEVADILLMLEWVSAADTANREKIDSELIESWTPVNPADPTLLNYELEIPASYRIDDKFVKNFCKDKFYIHFVSTEDQTIKDTIHLHYSPLLTAKGEQPKFESYHDKIKIPQIESFQVTLTADKELLTPMYKDFLNPLEICIVGAKEMPAGSTSLNKYEPVYVQAKFFDGTVIKTHELPHNPTCKWMYKQVIPVGFMDHIKLMEALRTMPLLFEVHDQDELAKNNIKDFKHLIDVKYEEPAPPVEVADPKAKGKAGAKKPEEPKKDDKKDAKGKDAKGKKDVKKKKDTKTFEPIKPVDDREFIRTNYGVSNFNLNDLLNPHLKDLKLRNYIVPIAKYENKDSTNLDLNTTARREVQGAHIACDYISNDSYLVVTFEIAHAIRLFKKPPPPAVPEPVVETQAKGKAKPAATKPITPAQKGRLPSAQEKKPEVPAPIVEEKPVFERAVYVFPYKSPIHTPKLLSIIQRINMEAFGQQDGNPLYITTKALTDDEKRSRELDIITGIEFIDHEYRTFILEGLSDKAMKRLEEEFPKTQPNSKALKILKNPDVKFKERIYADCNIDIKKIRLRENLAKLLIRPEIYLRSKVPEHIYNILISFCELRRCENIKAVVASNLFPPLDDILAMERKYGDALTDEDISGIEGLPKKLITRTVGKLASMSSEMATSAGMTVVPSATNRGMQSKSVAFSKDNSMTMEKVESAVTNTKVIKPHLATVIDDPKANKYNLHMNRPYPVQEGQEVHTRANTKLNIYEQQKAELREIVRNDPNHFYTYSVNYLSQSIDPYSPDDIKREEDEHKKKMWKTPNGFQTILKKDKNDYMEHPKKPHQSKIDELSTFPWHQDKLEETKKLANSRGDPIRNGVDFKLRIGGIDTFSSPEIVAEEKITAVEKERRIREAKRLSEEEWKKKVIVDNTYFYTSTCTNKTGQLDKIKNIREGDAKKKGIILKDNRLKQTTLGTTKTVQENPISMYLEHEWEELSTKNLFEREVDLKKTTSAYDFRRNIKEAHQYDFIYKPMKETFPQIVK